MSTVLIFAVLPAAIVLVITALARAGSNTNRPTRRYRPGRPYDFTPIWLLSSPAQVGPALSGRAAERPEQRPAIESGIIEDASGQRVLPGPVGGASDRW